MENTEIEEQAKKAYSIHENIVANEKVRRALLATNASLLAEMKEKKFYKIILGDPEGEWSGYLSDTEVYYSRNQAYNLIRIWQKFEVIHKIPLISILDIPMGRLVDMLPIIFTSNEELTEYLHHAKVNLSKDWQITIRERKGLATSESCKHNFKPYQICRSCGLKETL